MRGPRRFAWLLLLILPVLARAYGPMYDMGNLGILDSSWYYQAIQYDIALKSQPERPAEERSKLVTAPSSAVSMPARLAAGYPPASRAQAEATFRSLLRSYADIEKRFSIPPGDLGGAAAAFVAGCVMAMHGADFPDEHFAPLVDQMRTAVAAVPGFARLSERDRREAYEQLAIIGMFMASTQMALKSRPDAALAQRTRDAARRYLGQFVKGDVTRLSVGAKGLVLR
ncbi:DUF6683 family protein [Piscinibacter sp.]|uniref:DUF6683 family protein n=1 Tax=Piscinibacter sp. TaxID=1903157 RepID=UPI0039E2F6FD